MRLILHLRCASSASAPERTAAMRELQMRCASSAHNLLSTTVNCVVFLRRRHAAHEAHASCATLSPKHLGGTVEWEGVGKTPGRTRLRQPDSAARSSRQRPNSSTGRCAALGTVE